MIKHLPFLKQVMTLAFFFILNSFSVQAGCVYEVALQVELKEKESLLTWTTQSETNNQYFIIEVSRNGIDFETLSQVDAAGNSNEVQEYHFLDTKTAKTNTRYFYRLVQIDFDKTTTFSQVVVLTRGSKGKLFELTRLNSSIVSKYFDFNIDSAVAGELRYSVQTQMGEILLKDKVEVKKGDNLVSIDLNEVEVGRHQFSIKIKNEIMVISLKKVDSSDLPTINLTSKGGKKN